MSTISSWLRTVERREQGPSPTFGPAHALLALMTIALAGSIGRQALARQTGLGEGAIRTVLKKFRQEDLVEADTIGCHLTDSGRRLYESLSKKVSQPFPLNSSGLVVGPSQVSIIVRSSAKSVRSGIEQRDSSIITGAAGATTYVIKAGKFAVPGGSDDCEKDFPGPSWSVLRGELDPKTGDVVILCGARNESAAKLGALAAALTLL